MVLDRARWLRRSDRTADALALWRRAGEAAQRDAPADELAAFWTERNLLARRLLRDGDAAGAYALAAQHGRITAGADAGRRVPGGLHRTAPAERSGRGDAAFHRSRRSVQGGDHPRPRALLARPCRRCRGRRSEAGISSAPRPGRPPSMASLPRSRWATMPRRWPAASTRCTTPPIRAIRCWRSPTARWCAPPRCWSPGTIRTGPAPSCCGWTSLRPIRPTAP